MSWLFGHDPADDLQKVVVDVEARIGSRKRTQREVEAHARKDLEQALKRCAEVVRDSDPAQGADAIKVRHKRFDELWLLVIQTSVRVHGQNATRNALRAMGRYNDSVMLT